MSTDETTERPRWTPLALNEELYKLRADEIAFYKAQTGIDDDEALRRHILACQAEAYKVCHPPAPRGTSAVFVEMRVIRAGGAVPVYPQLCVRQVRCFDFFFVARTVDGA